MSPYPPHASLPISSSCYSLRSELSVWCSNMRRAKDTAREVKCANIVEWRSLREIEVSADANT